jgi:glucan endo-1,3-beta-D-glucosidase
MKAVTNAVALAMAVSPAAAGAIKGFNYGATNDDGSERQQSDFESQFETAKGLVGAEDFTSARLYTMVVRNTSQDLKKV